MKGKIALGLLLLISAIEVLFGSFYVYTPQILPYHETYLQIRHDELPAKAADLMLSMLKIIGVLLIAQGVTLAALAAGPFRRREAWAWWLVVTTSTITLVPVLVITLYISLHSPWWLVATVLILLYVSVSLHTPFSTK